MAGSSTGPRNFKVQYNFDSATSTTWSDITLPSGKIIVYNYEDNGFSIDGGGSLKDVSLSSDMSNRSKIYLRWIMTSNTSVGGAILVLQEPIE